MLKIKIVFGLVCYWFVATELMAETTLIGPMMEGLRGCKSAVESLQVNSSDVAVKLCKQRKESAAELVEEKLLEIGPETSANGRFKLGYTLGMPLLSYVEVEDKYESISRERIRDDLRIISQSDRELVLYIFSNHFIGSDQLRAAEVISKDSQSLMRLASGRAPIDKYFDSGIYPWAVGGEKSKIRTYRTSSLKAVVDEVCKLPAKDRAKIRAVTTLGEVHHFFPDFKNGMSYGGDYQITDYGENSVAEFRAWLEGVFLNIDVLNAQLSSNYRSFDDIDPPSKNINKDHLNSFFEHVDEYSHGVIPFFGWAYDDRGMPFEIYVYLNGQYVGSADTDLTRLDVEQGIDELNHSNVGYRYNLDFTKLPKGVHKVELRFIAEGKTSLLKQYELVVMGRTQSSPAPIVSQTLVGADYDKPKNIRYWSDHPENLTAVFYNPLSKLWNDFRELQIKEEIEYYAGILKSSCMDDAKIFSAQIAPMFNGSWNPNFFATTESLKKNENYSLGINLYGGIVYGDHFFDWLSHQQHKRYGVPEMHPMTSQNPDGLVKAINRHNLNGAVFLSPYFISLQPERFGRDKEHGKFRVSPDNHQYGSSQYFKALQLIMRQ